MRLHRTKRQYGYEINIAPLIDVVFLLIIFFLAVSHITQVQVEALALPEAEEGQKSEEMATGRIIINVHKDARIVTAGKVHSTKSLEQMLSDELEYWGEDGLFVLLRGDREAPWARMSDVMQICIKNGISQINVAVIEPGENAPQL